MTWKMPVSVRSRYPSLDSRAISSHGVTVAAPTARRSLANSDSASGPSGAPTTRPALVKPVSRCTCSSERMPVFITSIVRPWRATSTPSWVIRIA